MSATAVVTALHVPCPFCGTRHTFTQPPAVRSERCDGCKYWVCETEWHAALMQTVAEALRG